MRIVCKKGGGLGFRPVKDAEGEVLYPALDIKAGDNEVDADHWAALGKVLNPVWLAAIKESHLTFDAPEPQAEPLADPVRMKATDARAAVRAAETVDEVLALADGEDRTSVLEEIERKLAKFETEAEPDESEPDE